MTQGFQNLNPDGVLVRTLDGRNSTFEEPLVYVTKTGVVLRIPIGATTDWRSSPRLTWPVVPPFGQGAPAFGFHDACYRDVVEILCDDGQWRKYHPTKQQSDDLLLEIMEFLGCQPWEMHATYDAVVQFGDASFKADRSQT